jgi:GDP-L-fucose synthase
MLLVQSQAYRQQYGFNSIVLFPVNLYGPKDNFDLETSHVIPALIRKCIDAQSVHRTSTLEPVLEVWGAGTPHSRVPLRQDAAEGILLAAERYNKSEPVNLGAGFEISMQRLGRSHREADGLHGTSCVGFVETGWTTKEDARRIQGRKGVWFWSKDGVGRWVKENNRRLAMTTPK